MALDCSTPNPSIVDCLIEYGIDIGAAAAIAALGFAILYLDVFMLGEFGGALKGVMSIMGGTLMGAAASAMMMCASRQMVEFFKSVIDEQLLLAEEYQALFMQMNDKVTDFQDWGKHEEQYEACELGAVARARTPALHKVSTEAYKYQKQRNKYQIGRGRKIFRVMAKEGGNLPAAMMAVHANMEEHMRMLVETGNWKRRLSILNTVKGVPSVSGNMLTGMDSFASMGQATAFASNELAGFAGDMFGLAKDVYDNRSVSEDSPDFIGPPASAGTYTDESSPYFIGPEQSS